MAGLGRVKEVVRQDISNWQHNATIDLHTEMMKLAINVITKTNFGSHFSNKQNAEILHDEYHKIIQDFDDASIGIWTFGEGSFREEKFKENLLNFKEEMRRIVIRHKKLKEDGDFDIAPFLDTALDNIEDEDEVIHQAITFMIGGFHTSGNYMTWFFYNLALRPDIQV